MTVATSKHEKKNSISGQKRPNTFTERASVAVTGNTNVQRRPESSAPFLHMPTYRVGSLEPDVHGIDITLQVVKLLVTVDLKEENIRVYEYLVGDDTGCIVANTLNEITGCIKVKGGYTQIVNGSLRLVIRDFENDASDTANMTVDTQNNVSLERFVRLAA